MAEPTKAEERSTCPTCGTEFSGAGKLCPVCMLRQGLRAHRNPGEPGRISRRLGHYELMTDEEGTPIELGRGAMGVTYQAFDSDLRCPVVLKVISERYLNDKSARLRFLREARVAARVRHSNVASVFHLGRSGEDYFYAMEFVEGETLENLIKRSGPLEPKLALEIVTQVASGLAAVHKQNIVHRDIKPANVMVGWEEANLGTVKIIDLGLAKTIESSNSEMAITMAGGFAGTPEFSSPEQFVGLSVDIRSDLYSLGVTFWAMLAGQPPFRGTPAEVMHQHQRRPLPLERLENVPQPVIALLEVLLEKDPVRRFQTPIELLKAVPRIKVAMAAGRPISHESLRNISSRHASDAIPGSPGQRWPDRISLARLPVTGKEVFGREEDLALLDAAWANPQVNVVSVVAWAGVGKSTLVNHWLRGLAADQYRSADLVFGWSFYRQGTTGGASSADEFVDAALAWFGDPDPRLGTAWEKGERLAKLIAYRRTLLVLDGLEPLQNPPGLHEGRLRDPSLQALLRELAASNTGLCLITTRLAVADIAEHESTSALRRNLEQLSSDAGEKLLRALGVQGHAEELQSASREFGGHCLALTLLGSFLSDAYGGDIRCRQEVAERLSDDIRQGDHARKVMASYQAWLGEGPELSFLRMLGLFDRPADEKTIEVVLQPPAIPGLTESLTDLSPIEWRTILARLRTAKLLDGEDPYHPGHLGTHPLVREYFGEQLRSQRTDAWQEGNRRLYHYYRTVAPQLPPSFREMEPLFLAVVCGCHAGLYREALHEVYLPRIQRGKSSFAANVLGARGALLSVLVHFFEQGQWGAPVKTGIEGQNLTAEDQLFILMQAALYLTATRGMGAPEVRICYQRAEALCHSHSRPLLLYVTLMGQWRYSFATDKLTATLQIAKRIYSLAEEQNDSSLMMGACQAMTSTLYFSGDFEAARRYAKSCVRIWCSEDLRSPVEEVIAPVVVCLCYEALAEWHFGEMESCRSTMAKAVRLATERDDTHALAEALFFAAMLAQYESIPGEVERLASDLMELSARHNFAFWLAGGDILRGWARSALGEPAPGISRIERGIQAYRATGSTLGVPFGLILKAEALHLADRIPEALDAIGEANKLVENYGERSSCVELYRLRGVFLTRLGADQADIEDAFRKAIHTAKQQKSSSLAARAEATYADYRRPRGSA
jgi:tRNA A-37 threonylcarbamoyl transferase component Bud32/predicted ATPase